MSKDNANIGFKLTAGLLCLVFIIACLSPIAFRDELEKSRLMDWGKHQGLKDVTAFHPDMPRTGPFPCDKGSYLYLYVVQGTRNHQTITYWIRHVAGWECYEECNHCGHYAEITNLAGLDGHHNIYDKSYY